MKQDKQVCLEGLPTPCVPLSAHHPQIWHLCTPAGPPTGVWSPGPSPGLQPTAHHLARGKDEGGGLRFTNAHDHGRKSLQARLECMALVT
jgi:hypothetical protein